MLSECVAAIKNATDLPDSGGNANHLPILMAPQDARGIDSLGMHLEAWDESVRRHIMPGKAEVPRAFYLEAFAAAVRVFGRGQVSTYLLAGLGDSVESLHEAARVLIDLGVYPFIVPFVPVSGTPLAGHRPPSAEFLRNVAQSQPVNG